MGNRDNVLFHNKDLRAAIEGQVALMLREINGLDTSRLRDMDVDEYCAALVEKFKIEPIELDEANTKVGTEEVIIDARQDPYAMVLDRGRPVPVPATKISYYIPFTGEAPLFDFHPSSFTCVFPRGRVKANELILDYVRRDYDAEAVKASFKSDVATIKQYLGWIKSDVEGLPARLEREARGAITARQAKLQKDQAMVDSLGFPKK